MLAEWAFYLQSLLPNTGDFGKMPEEAAPISYALCGVATLFLCKYTGGIGYLIVDMQRSFRIPDMYAWSVILALLGFGLNEVFERLERRATHWSGAPAD